MFIHFHPQERGDPAYRDEPDEFMGFEGNDSVPRHAPLELKNDDETIHGNGRVKPDYKETKRLFPFGFRHTPTLHVRGVTRMLYQDESDDPEDDPGSNGTTPRDARLAAKRLWDRLSVRKKQSARNLFLSHRFDSIVAVKGPGRWFDWWSPRTDAVVKSILGDHEPEDIINVPKWTDMNPEIHPGNLGRLRILQRVEVPDRFPYVMLYSALGCHIERLASYSNDWPVAYERPEAADSAEFPTDSEGDDRACHKQKQK